MAGIPADALSTLNDLAASGSRQLSTRQVAEYTGQSPKAASALLSRLVDAGLLDRVARGHFVLRDIGLLGTKAASEDLSLAVQAALGGRPARIAYRSALSELGLLSHPSRGIHLASPERLRIRTISGRRLIFHKEPDGILRLGADHLREGVWRSTQARALLESAQQPSHAGGLPAVAEALMTATIDPRELRELDSRLHAHAGLRRIGSLSDHLAGPLADQLTPPPRSRFIPLDPAQTRDGDSFGAWQDTRWGVSWPVPARELQNAIG